MPQKIVILFVFAAFIPLSTLRADQSGEINLLPPDWPIEQVIDHYIDAKIQDANKKAAALTTDDAYLRRLTLDLLGRIPTPVEIANYRSNDDSAKKSSTVDRLMTAPGFTRHLTDRFVVILKGQGVNRRGRNSGSLREYLQTSFDEKRSWDRMFREMMLPDESDPKLRGAGEFLKGRVRDLDKMTVDVSTIFFGVNISCAQCHEHPHVEQWTQDHFYGMKSFFARTFDNGGFLAERSFGQVKYTPNKGKEKVAPVMFLTGKQVPIPDMGKNDKNDEKKEKALFARFKKQKKPAPLPKFSLRANFVKLALERESQQYFSRAIVNRLWHQYFGRGLVMPLDQMHAENPASHPELLQWLARDMANHDYDVRRLIRGIVRSNAYARSSRWLSKDFPPDNLFAKAIVRPLAPMQLARSLLIASADPETLPKDAGELQKYHDQLERRAAGLASLFPEPDDDFQVSVKEAMLFSNNERIQKELIEGNNKLSARLEKIDDVGKRAELAVRTVFSRPPTPSEIENISNFMRERNARRQEACRHVVWALLSSSEFRFNH